MKCYNHQANDAVGICKNCNKGLCKDCITEVENGIACTITCIDEVIQLNSLITKNKNSFKTASGAYSRNGLIYLSIGIVFIIFGFITEGLIGFLTVMGVIFIIGSIFSFKNADKYKKDSLIEKSE